MEVLDEELDAAASAEEACAVGARAVQLQQAQAPAFRLRARPAVRPLVHHHSLRIRSACIHTSVHERQARIGSSQAHVAQQTRDEDAEREKPG
eukprot:437471-Rhodomonas_salina.2